MTKEVEVTEATEPVTTYQNDVVPKRNILGHVKRELKDGVYVLLDKKGECFLTLNTTRTSDA